MLKSQDTSVKHKKQPATLEPLVSTWREFISFSFPAPTVHTGDLVLLLSTTNVHIILKGTGSIFLGIGCLCFIQSCLDCKLLSLITFLWLDASLEEVLGYIFVSRWNAQIYTWFASVNHIIWRHIFWIIDLALVGSRLPYFNTFQCVFFSDDAHLWWS